MPRSLRFCYDWLDELANGLCDFYGTGGPAKSRIEDMRDFLKMMKMEAVFQMGLHEFLVDFRARNSALTDAISDDYNFG